MMKKMIAVGLMGMGFVVAQGCAVEPGGAEETSAVSGELNNACYSMQGINTTKRLFGGRDGHRVGPLGYAERSRRFPVTRLTFEVRVVDLSQQQQLRQHQGAILGQQDFTVDQNILPEHFVLRVTWWRPSVANRTC